MVIPYDLPTKKIQLWQKGLYKHLGTIKLLSI